MFRKGLILLLLAPFMLSCGDNSLKINVSHVKEEVEFVHFDEALFALGTVPGLHELSGLRSRYPEFADVYSYQVLRTGSMADTSGWLMMLEFLSDTTTLRLKELVETKFSGNSSLRKELVGLFKHYSHYFPGKPLPVVYFCISGFNESVFTSEGIVGISLDKYLGSDCDYYTWLDLPRYKLRKMIPGMIPPDVAYTWGMTEFPIRSDATSLLDHMIHQGKLLYFTEAMLPRTADSLRTGFTSRQLRWCAQNEAQMWNYLVENKMLFSTQQMDIVRYINDGPSTNGFPPESPARTGAWLGRQIIRAYMKRNPDVTLAQLMAITDYQEILNASAYAPQ